MLTPKLIDIDTCSTVETLINDIDCKVAKLGSNLYNNLTLMLDYPVDTETFLDLLIYRRILQYKQVNSEYLHHFSIHRIASRIKLLKYR